jgi:hypothetical protein
MKPQGETAMINKSYERDTIGTENFLPVFAKPLISSFYAAQKDAIGYHKYKIRCRKMPNAKKYEFWIDAYTQSKLLIKTKFAMVDFGAATNFIEREMKLLKPQSEDE